MVSETFTDVEPGYEMRCHRPPLYPVVYVGRPWMGDHTVLETLIPFVSLNSRSRPNKILCTDVGRKTDVILNVMNRSQLDERLKGKERQRMGESDNVTM